MFELLSSPSCFSRLALASELILSKVSSFSQDKNNSDSNNGDDNDRLCVACGNWLARGARVRQRASPSECERPK